MSWNKYAGEKNVAFKGVKHEIVKALVLADGKEIPEDFSPEYKGDLNSLPRSTSWIKKLPTATLQHVLKYHNLSAAGRKDSLVLRTFLLRNGRLNLASYMQACEIQKLINLAQSLIFYQ